MQYVTQRIVIPPVDIHLISSAHVAGQTFQVKVAAPAAPTGSDERLPVVYATDANSSFDAFRQVLYSMGARIILVGVGYPSDSLAAGVKLRARDLTFPGYPKMDLSIRDIEGAFEAEPGTRQLWGAVEFQGFFEDELIPFIESAYPVVPGDRTYFGHSGGGGFGLYTMFTKTGLFSKYVVSSPGLAYHGTSSGIGYDNYEFMAAELRRFLNSGHTLEGVRLYMSVGTDEEYEPGMEVWRITSTFIRFIRLLKDAAIPGLELINEELHGETHGTAWILSFIHGVQAVQGWGRWAGQ
jgi:predicted alpha/beta superfamily hydrolase